MSTDAKKEFMDFMSESIHHNQFLRITLSERIRPESELKSVRANMVVIKNILKVKVVYVYTTREITKNYDPEEARSVLQELLMDFKQANLFTTREHRHLITKKNEIKVKRMSYAYDHNRPKTGLHDKLKKRFISVYDNVYLTELEVTTIEGKVKRHMEGKFRQIDKYVEILDGIIRSADLPGKVFITDMGSGKGYLTFALYDHLHNTLKMDVEMTGVEFRQDLVEATNVIAFKAGFDKLKFVNGNIFEAEIPRTDILIALHACDTATDDAIYRGIQHDAAIIICAPCCHKQLRRQIAPQNLLKHITRHGILAERQAEIVTDAIRAMILEAYGYKTKVFEFISGEHTAKNVMIAAVKNKDIKEPDASILVEVDELKQMFCIDKHHLESLLQLEE